MSLETYRQMLVAGAVAVRSVGQETGEVEVEKMPFALNLTWAYVYVVMKSPTAKRQL